MFWELGNGLVLTETKDAWQLFGDDGGTVEGAEWNPQEIAFSRIWGHFGGGGVSGFEMERK